MNDEMMTPAAWVWVGAIVIGLGSVFVVALAGLSYSLIWIVGDLF